jgi:hypothetical protein
MLASWISWVEGDTSGKRVIKKGKFGRSWMVKRVMISEHAALSGFISMEFWYNTPLLIAMLEG